MKMKYQLMNEAGADGGDGGSQSAATQTQTQPAQTSILQQGQQTEANNYDWIPEKHRATKEDGSIDVDASARKVSEAYKNLEQKLGSGDVPPKTAEEYAPKVEVEGFNFDEFKADPESQSFLKGAHAKGLTNDQVGFVIGEYLKRAPALVEGAQAMDAETATAELKTTWANEVEFKENVSLAFKAFSAFAVDADKAKINEIGNNPIVIRLLANIGKELKEDKSINNQQHVNDGDFNVKSSELRKQLQDLPAHDPKRKAIQDQLDSMYQSKYGDKKQFTGGGAVFSYK